MFIACMHNGGGSMVEGSDAFCVLGPFNTTKEADAAGEEFYNAIGNRQLQSEVWFTIVEIPTTPVDPKVAAREWAHEYLGDDDAGVPIDGVEIGS